jgi:hypothetical protein
MYGWDVSFEKLKWIGEWKFVNGSSTITHPQSLLLKFLRCNINAFENNSVETRFSS